MDWFLFYLENNPHKIMIYFLWILTFWAFVLFYKRCQNYGNLQFYKIFSNFKIKTEKKSILKKTGQHFIYTKHSFSTNLLANHNFFKQKCLKIGGFCSFSDYLNTKNLILEWVYFLGFLFLLLGNKDLKNVSCFILYAFFFFLLPDILIQIEKEKREKDFLKEVPYFIDLFIITLKTGLNIEKTLWYITKKKTFFTNIIRKKLHNLKFGRSLESLFLELEEEIQNEEFQSFLKQLRQAKKLGVALADSLEIQSQCIRAKRKQRAEELSRTAAVKISLPLVLFIFPALLIIYVGPGILSLLKNYN
jgi:Flp pilus assembly protein TadB